MERAVDAPAPAYPAEWERHETLRDGRRVFIRPFKPEDVALYPQFLSGVTDEDLRLRFFAPIRRFSDEFIRKLAAVDYRDVMVFVAFDENTAEPLGVVRLHRDPDGKGGEYAVLLRSALKGCGLGWLLMRQMIAYARSLGLETIHGQVLPENATILSMCSELGFHIAGDPQEHGLKVVTLPLKVPPRAA